MAEKQEKNKYLAQERGEARGYTFATSNTMLQPITQEGDILGYGGELTFFDNEYTPEGNDNGDMVPVVDCDTGLSTTLTSLELDILTYFCQQIDTRRNDPNIREFRQTLPGRIRERQVEQQGKPRLTLKTYPTLTGVKINDIVRARYPGKQSGKNKENILRAFYSVSRKGYPFVYKEKDGKVLRRISSRFFHISHPYYATYVDKKTNKTLEKKLTIKGYKKEEEEKKDKEGKVVRVERVVRYDKDINVLESCDIILEDEFFYFASGFFRQPNNILTLKFEAQVPSNELYDFLYNYLVKKLSIKVKEYSKSLKEIRRNLKNDGTLTDEQRDERLEKYEREYFTISIGVPYIMERLRSSSYHRVRNGKTRNALGVFNDQLPEVKEALKRIGLVKENLPEGKGSYGARMLKFHLNSNWYVEQKEKMQQLEPQDEGDDEVVEEEYLELETE